ncbi:hypothetical protein [Paenibacillus aestuarii]|uniref:Uncharacterized protein n=1 Tax=Paenibacillus aestuarii TaxID=516965 RepID=A0ABW0KFD2_9BACL|nr:hypothetical protein [Paenibacillus aestuarii]
MKRSKWLKWQIGAVVIAIVFYLFQEVKASPEFLAAAAAATKQKAPVVEQQKPEPAFGNGSAPGNETRSKSRREGRRGGVAQGNGGNRAGNGSDNLNQGRSSTNAQVQPHTRSQAS